jgi:hypothetical protein
VAAPGGSREWLFQRGSGDATWTVSRSIAGFTGGSPSATTAGTASDATALFGAASLFSATPGRWFVSVDDASPNGWTAFAITLGGGNTLTFLADEPMLSGTTASEDTDPHIWVGYYNSTGLTAVGSQFQVTAGGSIIAQKRWIPAAANARVSFQILYDQSGSQTAPAANTTSAQIGQTPSGGRKCPS